MTFVDVQTAASADIDRLSRLNVTVLDDALPAELNRPKTRNNALAGGILGVVLGVLIVFVMEYLDDTLKTIEDVDRYLGLTTLGTIPTAQAAGNRQRGVPR